MRLEIKKMNNHRGSKSEFHPKVFSVCYSMIENYVVSIFNVAGHGMESKPILTGSLLKFEWILPG